MIQLSPINRKRWQRFKQNRRGYWCFYIFLGVTLLAMVSEVFLNSKALMVSYEGERFFPVFQGSLAADTFGLEGKAAPDYQALKERFAKAGKANWVLMPLVPYDAHYIAIIDQTDLDLRIGEIEREYEDAVERITARQLSNDVEMKKLYELELATNLKKGRFERLKYHPLPPETSSKHYLGTDPSGRDVLARLFYGYRIAICFALVLLVVTYLIGVSVGCMMGYFGGAFDLLVQRLIEILSNIPFLYVIIILAAVLREHKMQVGFWTLVGIYAIFGWMGMTWYMRTTTYKEKTREYIWAAKALGASNSRIIFSHILPNVVSLLVTFIPFSISGSIIGLTSLDYLGYGLPKGTPSWGELIRQGTEDMNAYWIVLSVVSALIVVLFLINSIGEAVREAFDPKQISRYE